MFHAAWTHLEVQQRDFALSAPVHRPEGLTEGRRDGARRGQRPNPRRGDNNNMSSLWCGSHIGGQSKGVSTPTTPNHAGVRQE